jgi:5-methylcytosine-specific restriction endonuclease McrA
VTKDEYAEYLQSPHWKRRRQNFLVAHQYRCQECGLDCSIRERRHYINVHHKSYKRLWHEESSDLVALCRECHREEHGMEGMMLSTIFQRMARAYSNAERWQEEREA